MVFKFVFKLSSAHLEFKKVGSSERRSCRGSLVVHEEGKGSWAATLAEAARASAGADQAG